MDRISGKLTSLAAKVANGNITATDLDQALSHVEVSTELVTSLHEYSDTVRKESIEQAYWISYAAYQLALHLEDLALIARTAFWLGIDALNTERLKEAKSLFAQAVEIFDQLGDLLSAAKSRESLGLVYHRMKNYEEAIRQHESALSFYRREGYRLEQGRCLYNMAASYLELGALDAAGYFCQLALPIARLTGGAFYESVIRSLSWIRRELGLPPLKEATRLHNGLEEGYQNGSSSSSGTQQRITCPPEETPFSAKLLHVEEDFDSLLAQATKAVETGECERAISLFSKAIKLEPRRGDLYIGRGLAYVDMRSFKEAERDLSKAVELSPDNPIPLLIRARFYAIVTNEMGKAIRDLDRVIELQKDCGEAYVLRGLAYLGLLEFDQAESDLREGLRLDPGNKEALRALALLGQ